MASEFDQYTQLNGVIVPYTGWKSVTIDAALTTAEALKSTFIPGEVVLKEATVGSPIYNSFAKFSITGEQTSKQEIAITRGGSPGHGGDGMRAAWRDEQNVWRGYLDHNIISDIDTENKLFKGSTTNVDLNGAIQNGFCQNNTAIISDKKDGSIILVGLDEEIMAYHYLPKTFDLSASRTILEKGNANSAIGANKRLGLPDTKPVTGYVSEDGTLTCFGLTINEAGSPTGSSNLAFNLWTVRADGSSRSARYPSTAFRTVGNWAFGTDLGLLASSVITSMRCAADNEGNVLLLINLILDSTQVIPKNTLVQLASNNGGLTFELIGYNVTTAPADASYANNIDCFYYNGKFSIIKTAYNFVTSKSNINSYNIATPFFNMFSVSPTAVIPDEINGRILSIASYTLLDGRAAILVAADDTTAASRDVYIIMTSDGGLSWNKHSNGFAKNLRVSLLSVCEVEGRAILLLSDTISSSDPEYCMFLKCGGWENISHPRILGSSPYELASYGCEINDTDLRSFVYLPVEIPTALNWTLALTGTAITTITAGQPWLNIIKATSSTIYYTQQLKDCTYDTGFIAAATFEHTSGSHVSLNCQVWDVGNRYEIEARLTSTALELVDGQSGLVKATYAVTSNTAVKAKLAFRGGWATLFVLVDDGIWQVVGRSNTFSSVAVANSDAVIRFGCPVSATASVARFYFIGAINFSGGGDQAYFNDDLAVYDITKIAPFGLHGGPVPQKGFGEMGFPSGLRVSSSEGWAQRGETHIINEYSPYGLEKTLKASPSDISKVEVSSSTSSEIVYMIDTGSFNRRHSGDALALAAINTDLEAFTVSISEDGSSWSALGDVSLIEQSGLSFLRSGSLAGTLIPGGVNANAKFYEIDELKGCKIKFNDGTVAKVVGNSAGRFTTEGKKLQIHIDYKNAIPPQTGTISIIRREVASIFTGIEAYFKYLKITIPTQTTVNFEGGFTQDWATIGSILFGTFIPFSNKYSSSRSVIYEPNISRTLTRYGISNVKKLGPSLRGIQISWAEGYDTSEASSQAAGDYVALPIASGNAVGHRGSGTILEGIKRATEEGELPLVYIPKITTAESLNEYGDIFSWNIVGKEAVLLAETIETVSRDVILGEELTSEVVRMSGISIRELA
jgi:hypothetical protein